MTLHETILEIVKSPSSDRELVIALRRAISTWESKQPFHAPSEPERIATLRGFSQFAKDQKVVDFAHLHKLTLPHKEFWWWLNDDERPGHIHGLDGSKGIPRITNGIDVYIELPDGKLFKGHRDWLKYDRRPSTRKASAVAETETSLAKLERVSTAFVKAAKETLENFDVFAKRYRDEVGEPLGWSPSGNAAEDCVALAPYVKKYWERIHV